MLFLYQVNQGGAPSALVTGQRVAFHGIVSFQEGMNRSAKVTLSFAVNNADLVNTFIQTGADILGYEAAQLVRTKGMKIQRAVNGQLRQFFLIIIQWTVF